jgi:hypothetical protein
MGDVLIFFVWIVGLILAVVVIVAQFQLFAIRRLLEALVKQPGGVPLGGLWLSAERAGVDPGLAPDASPTSEPAARSRGVERA